MKDNQKEQLEDTNRRLSEEEYKELEFKRSKSKFKVVRLERLPLGSIEAMTDLSLLTKDKRWFNRLNKVKKERINDSKN